MFRGEDNLLNCCGCVFTGRKHMIASFPYEKR